MGYCDTHSHITEECGQEPPFCKICVTQMYPVEDGKFECRCSPNYSLRREQIKTTSVVVVVNNN